MKLRTAIVASTLLAACYGQPSEDRAKTEFDVASIRARPPLEGFHFAAESGQPDFTNPGVFRCTNCTLATLVRKAFDLQNYQLPGRAALGTDTFDVMARIPAGATPEDSRAMLQNLLKERFGLAYHYKESTLRGYHLVIAKNGSKLKESAEDPNHQRPNGNPDQHRPGQGHTHEGLVTMFGSATYRGDHKTTADLAQILSDQLSLPVDDLTRLPGKYDVALSWSGNLGQAGGSHADGAGNGGAGGHGDHGGGGTAGSPGGWKRGDESGLTLFDALQSQLGLKLVPSEQTIARIFVIDRVEHNPTAN